MNVPRKQDSPPRGPATVEGKTSGQDEGSWYPWSFFLVDVTQLLGILQLPFALLPIATKALASDSANSSDEEEDEAASSFLKKARNLSSSQRRSACVLCSAGVRSCNGRALREFHEGDGTGTFFRDDPEGWIRNGLWCLDENMLPLEAVQSASVGFVQCSILEFERNSIGLHEQDAKIVPWVYVGTGSYRKDIERWRAGFWLRDMQDGYALKRSDLSQQWLKMCPGASVPDPVFRFLATPNSELRREAELFMRQIEGADTAVSSSHIQPPSQFKYGPLYRSQWRVRKRLTGADRQQITNRLWSEQNPGGTVWKHPQSKPRSQDAEFWFLHEADFLKVKDAKN